jgi:ribosomal protein L37AE/L43A
MHQYRYIFEKGSKKHQCPACHKKRFVRYTDVQTQEYLPEVYGKCDREMNCGYQLNPYKNGYAKDSKTKTSIYSKGCIL